MAYAPEPNPFAWEWFKFHAEQRLKAFDFFIVIVGALSIALKDPISSHARLQVVVLGAFGVVTSIGFLLLDIRNRQLVEGAKRVLEESGHPLSPIVLTTNMHHPVVSHRFVLRAFMSAAGLAFAASVAWAVLTK